MLTWARAHEPTLTHLESSTPPVIPDEGVLVQLSGSTVDEVSAALLQEGVVGQFLLTHTIQRGVAQHADIQVSVPCTWRGVTCGGVTCGG